MANGKWKMVKRHCFHALSIYHLRFPMQVAALVREPRRCWPCRPRRGGSAIRSCRSSSRSKRRPGANARRRFEEHLTLDRFGADVLAELRAALASDVSRMPAAAAVSPRA